MYASLKASFPESSSVEAGKHELSPTKEAVISPASKPGKVGGDFHNQLLELAKTREWFLIQGEPGVGKRYCARELHMMSPITRGGEYIEISPATSNEELQAILFDEERKRCEGMLGRKVPKVDERSTIFVSHVDELSLFAQTRCVRFIAQHTVAAPRVRVIFSTCLSPREMAGSRILVEKLNTFIKQLTHVVIPPLRERSEEIPEIAASILSGFLSTDRRRRFVVKPETLEMLKPRYWRDNVVELVMMLEEAVRQSRKGVLALPEDIPDEVEQVEKSVRVLQREKGIRLDDMLDALEKALVKRSLARTRNDLEKSARLLGLTEQNLRYRIRKYNLYIPPKRKRK